MSTPAPPPPGLAFAFRLIVTVAPPLEGGTLPGGRRRIIPITGGRAEGPRLEGEIPPFGADWQIIETEGLIRLVARYAVRTADGTLIGVTNRALRTAPPGILARLAAGEAVAPELYYFRGHISFEAPAGAHRWLSERLFVGSAARGADEVRIDVHELT